MTKQAYACIALLLLALPVGGAGTVTLEKAKYTELSRRIVNQKGKVILVDFWSVHCLPCMKKFPELVVLQERYARHGLRIITVTLDSVDKEAQALAFLKKQNATFTNLLLDEKPAVWQNKLRIKEVPCFYIFDRKGKIERKLTEAPASDYLEQLLTRLLNEKP